MLVRIFQAAGRTLARYWPLYALSAGSALLAGPRHAGYSAFALALLVLSFGVVVAAETLLPREGRP